MALIYATIKTYDLNQECLMKEKTKDFITRLSELMAEFEAEIEHRNSDDGLYVIVDGESVNIGWMGDARDRAYVPAMIAEDVSDWQDTTLYKERYKR